jgi:hypothetical protein
MPMKYFDRLPSWDVGPIIGALLIALAAIAATTPETAFSLEPVPQTAGCRAVSPGAANLVGALEGQPLVPERTVESCR